MMNIDQAIEQVEKLYQRVTGHEAPHTPAGTFAPINSETNLSMLLDMRMTQLLQLLQEPAVQQRIEPWSPPVSIWESDDKIVVCLEVCGVNKTDVDISTRDNMLIVTGTRNNITPVTHGFEPRMLEIPTGSFQRVIALPPYLTSPEINSDLRNGILEITVAKAEQKTSPVQAKKAKGSLQ